MLYLDNNSIMQGISPDLVQPLAHKLFGLAANLIANSYGWKQFLKKMG